MSSDKNVFEAKNLLELLEKLEIDKFAVNASPHDFPLELLKTLTPQEAETNYLLDKETAKKVCDYIDLINRKSEKRTGTNITQKVLNFLTPTSLSKTRSKRTFLSHFEDVDNLQFHPGDEWEMDPNTSATAAYVNSFEEAFKNDYEKYQTYTNVHQWTPLMYATALGRDVIIDIMVTKNIDLRAQNNSGQTALMIAAAYGHIIIVKKFIDYADKKAPEDANYMLGLHIVDNKGYTALHYAMHYAQDDIVDILLRLGADPNKADNEGMTPTLMACVDEIRERSLPVLLKYKGNLIVKNEDGKNGIDLSGDRDTVKKLFKEYKASSQ